MIEQTTMTCDFCGSEIEEGDKFTVVTVNIPSSLRKEMIAYFEAEVQPRYAGSPLSGMISVGSAVPYVWKLQACPCLFGILPGIRDTLAKQIRGQMRQALAAKRRSEAAEDELEETR